jgi:hypothetical protein
MKTTRKIGFWWALCILIAAPAVLATGVWHFRDAGNRLITGDVSIGGTATLNGTTTYTLGAAEKVLVDGSTTAQTQTAGTVDLNVSTITANVSALDISLTQANGTSSGANSYGAKLTLTANDADGDVDGLLITAAATANAAAGSYEYAIAYDCAENTSGACLDGILITSSGASGGLTDGIDVSASEITNAINIGSNFIAGDNSDTCQVGATDATFVCSRNNSGAFTFAGADDGGAADTVYDTSGAGAITVGSADVTAVTVTTDGSGTGELVLPSDSVGPGELTYAGRAQFTICGDATTVNNNTIYYGPDMAVVSSATVGLNRKCDTTAAGNATEATADAPAFTALAFQVSAMECQQADANASLSFTLRTAAGATSPSVTCSTVDNDLGCVADVQTTTAIASGATVAVAVASTSDIGTVPFVCTVYVVF